MNSNAQIIEKIREMEKLIASGAILDAPEN